MRHTVASLMVVALMGFEASSVRADTYGDAVLADNPTVFWRLGDASGPIAVDSSGNGHSATYYGNVTFGVPGPVVADGKTGVTWDGSTGYLMGNVPMSPSITVEAWAKSATSTWNNYGWIASARGSNGFIIHPDEGLTSVSFYFVNSGAIYRYVASVTPGDITGWNMYDMTYDNATGDFNVYLNGVRLSTELNVGAGLRSTSTIPVFVGQDDNLYGRFGQGSSADVSIYDHVLSDDEIMSHYQVAAMPEPATLTLLGIGIGGLVARRCWPRGRRALRSTSA